MEEPRCMQEGYVYINKNEEWAIKEDAPLWAKEEFKEFMKKVNPQADENGMIKNYSI